MEEYLEISELCSNPYIKKKIIEKTDEVVVIANVVTMRSTASRIFCKFTTNQSNKAQRARR